MKKYKIMFWASTIIIFLMMGIMPLINLFNPNGQDMTVALGYPIYAAYMISVFKILGSFALIIPSIPAKLKEWAYAGFSIDLVGALVSIWAVNGFSAEVFFPVVFMVILGVSYYANDKLSKNQKELPMVG